MLSVASLLNPISSESRGQRLPSSPPMSFTSSSRDSPHLSTQSTIPFKKQKMTKDGAIFAKGKVKGDLNFAPFEQFDEETMREIERFQVYPLGKIREYARHIPYNSEKKSFLEKTGRESFEVFQYVFKLPGEDKEYTVMWDYNVGLVRITPFFKCLKHTKTMPAKMLNLNPGLKEITHSITGGALVAQGYWMPYNCALAVCTTFCSQIAPALIPIFGPSFPSLCVPPEAPEHGRMIIDSQLIDAATTQAETFRLQYTNINTASVSSSTPPTGFPTPISSNSPRSTHAYSPSPSDKMDLLPQNPSRRLRLKRPFGTESERDTDADGSETSGSGDAYFCSPGPGPGHQPPYLPHPHSYHVQTMLAHNSNATANVSMAMSANHPSPWLSAIPRSTGTFALKPLSPPPLQIARGQGWRKRRLEDGEADDEYDSASAGSDKSRSDIAMGDVGEEVHEEEKRAAYLLMALCVRDGQTAGEAMALGHREKRRRATSM